MSSSPKLQSAGLGAPQHSICSEQPASAPNSNAAAVPTRSAPNALRDLPERLARRTGHSATTDIPQPAALSSAVESLSQLYKKRQKTEQLLLSILREKVTTPAHTAWSWLDGVYHGDAEPDDEQMAKLVSETMDAAQDFLETTKKLYSQLPGTFKEEAKFNNIINVIKFITHSREALNASKNLIEPLLAGYYIPKENVSTETLLKHMNELEEKQILQKARSLILNPQKNPQEPGTVDEAFALFVEPSLRQVVFLTVTLRTRLMFVLNQRASDDLRAAFNELGAPVATQEESETLLRKFAPKLTVTLEYGRRLLQYTADQMDELRRAMPHRSATLAEKQVAEEQIEHTKSMYVSTLIGMARYPTIVLKNVRTVAPGQGSEPEQTAWRQEIYWRVERLSGDACSCYDGTATINFYLSDTKVPSELQLEVMTLIAETAFSITTDLERIKADLGSSKRKGKPPYDQTLSVVQQLSEIITALGTSLSNQIADAAAERRRGQVRRSKPFERNAAKERMRRALQFAADHLNSFSVEPYEEPEPAPNAEGTPLPADSHADADKKKQPEMPAATAASGAGGPPGDGDDGDDGDDRFGAISSRLDTLQETVLPKHRADLTSARASARTVIERMEKELSEPGEHPMSPHDVWRSVTLVADRCKKASAKLQKWAHALEDDANFLKTKKARRHRDFSGLKSRFSPIKQATADLLAALREKESELSQEAQSMRLARSATMFALRPTLSGFEFLLANDCIAGVEKSPTYTPQHGQDYGVEFVIYLKTPDKLSELGCEPDEPYCALAHFHFPWHGKNKNKPTFCRFKSLLQRFLLNSDLDKKIYAGAVTDAETAAELFEQLTAMATTR